MWFVHPLPASILYNFCPTDMLCSHRQVPFPLWASVFPSVKWEFLKHPSRVNAQRPAFSPPLLCLRGLFLLEEEVNIWDISGLFLLPRREVQSPVL